MHILLLGASGQLGNALREQCPSHHYLTPLSRTSAPLCGDISKFSKLSQTIDQLDVDLIINAAAYTNVEQSETNQEQCMQINGYSIANLAQIAKQRNIWLIHYSTDYVFDGKNKLLLNEKAPVSPINFYGLSKLAGENAIRQSNCKHLIMRTSWLYGYSGHNFVKSILKKASLNEPLKVVDDQWGIPTSASRVAHATWHSIDRLQNQLSGTYHVCSSGHTNWYNFAKEVIICAKRHGAYNFTNDDCIKPIKSQAYQSQCKRPEYSMMDNSLFSKEFDYHFAPWQSDLENFISIFYNSSQTRQV